MKWRQAPYLPATHPRGGISLGGERKAPRKPLGERISPLSNPLHASIMEAIGRGVAPDVADDAASEMWLALLEGHLTPEQIKGEARRYCGRAKATYASRFGPRSLDEDLGDDGGFRMIDLLSDESSSSWLEEMGATAW